ncbi:MAG: DsbA family protein, partial [Gemmatimonadales bacterium]
SSPAKVTLVEYGDFQCPYCGAAYPIVKELEREAGALLRVVFRNFPLTNVHPRAEAAAEAAEAAGAQGRFWEMHDLIFENQRRLNPADLEGYARRAEVDLERFRADLEAHRWEPKVREQFRSGVVSGVNGTPTFFINGVRHDGGYGLEELLAAVKTAAGSER